MSEININFKLLTKEELDGKIIYVGSSNQYNLWTVVGMYTLLVNELKCDHLKHSIVAADPLDHDGILHGFNNSDVITEVVEATLPTILHYRLKRTMDIDTTTMNDIVAMAIDMLVDHIEGHVVNAPTNQIDIGLLQGLVKIDALFDMTLDQIDLLKELKEISDATKDTPLCSYGFIGNNVITDRHMPSLVTVDELKPGYLAVISDYDNWGLYSIYFVNGHNITKVAIVDNIVHARGMLDMLTNSLENELAGSF